MEFDRWVQRPRLTPKSPKVQPYDSAMRLEPMEKPDVNRSIGTDKPKRVKQKPNVTRTPQYLRYQNGLKTAPVAKAGGLIKFLQWFDENDAAINIREMSPTTLATFGLGWYISNTLTKDEKQKWQRQLDEEFNSPLNRQDEAARMSRTGCKLKKSAFEELQEYYRGLMG